MISTGLLACLLIAAAPARAADPSHGSAARSSVSFRSSRAEIAGARAVALLAARRDALPAAPHAESRRIAIERVGDRVRVRVTWTLDGPRDGAWFAATLVRGAVRVRSVTIDGRPAAAVSDTEATMFAAWIDGPRTIELVGDLTADVDRAPIDLELMQATRGVATIGGAPTWHIESPDGAGIVDTGGTSIGGGAAVRVVARLPEEHDGSELVVGHVGIGLSIGEAEIRGQARLQWLVRRGELTRVSFRASNVGDDIDVRGRDIREVKRSGDRFEIELQAPTTSMVTLDATWSSRTPQGDAELRPPAFELDGVTRTESSFELGRDGDIDVEPRLRAWRQVAAPALPTWGRDLVEGASAAAWVRHEAGSGSADDRMQLLRFVPVEAPDVVVASAEFEASSADHGMSLVKARYSVLNERASHLRVTLAPGSRLLAVEVFGADADVAKDGDVFLVPIPRSLETLEGLISIPVVVTVAVEQTKWARFDRRELPLPEIDAPIRSVSATWNLPRDMHATIDRGESGVVGVDVPSLRRKMKRRDTGRKTAKDATAYDFDDDSIDGAKMPDRELVEAENDRILSEAQSAYNENDFEGAQDRIDELRDRGGDVEELGKLQSNLDIVNAPVEPVEPTEAPVAGVSMDERRPAPAKTGLLRRIKDQARARGQKQVIQLEQRKAKAKALRAKGDYAGAADEYRSAIKDAKKLENLEQPESAVYDFEAEQLEEELETTSVEAGNRASIDAPSPPAEAPPPPPPPPPAEKSAEHGFGAPWFDVDTGLDVPDAEPTGDAAPTASPRGDGPRVLMPRRSGDVVRYTFDLWAPGTAGRLVMKSRRRIRRS